MDEKIEVSSAKSEGSGIPAGAEILKKETRVSSEKIENGYILTKNTEVKYSIGEKTDWEYQTKKYFSKEDPLEFKLKKGKSLVDNF